MTNIRLSYQTVEIGNIDIHLCTLRNRQEFYDPDGEAERLGINSSNWPIFGVLWPSGVVLANYIHQFDTQSKRILEIGCGTALTSLLLNKRHDDITVTDHHPEVGKFLDRNTDLNEDDRISFVRADWSGEDTKLGLFDLIIGSDLLYEDEHVELVGNFIDKHAKQKCEVVIVDPGRGRKNKLKKKMEGFGYKSSYFKPIADARIDDTFKGYILNFIRST